MMRSQYPRLLAYARRAGVRRSLASAAPRTGRTLLGSVGSATVLFVSGSVILWPVADLVGAPRIIARGMSTASSEDSESVSLSVGGPSLGDRARHHSTHPPSQRLAACLRRLLDAANGARAAADADESSPSRGAAQLVLVSGPGGVGKTLAARAISDEGGARPALYVSLREGAAPHDLLFALTQYLYSARKLGPIGTVAQSFGIFWIVLFDCLLGGSPAHTRAVHFSQVLSHARRALRLQQQRQDASGGRRALVVLDHYGTVLEAHPGGGGAGGDEGEYYAQMARRLELWAAAVCFDEGLADVVVVGGERLRPAPAERRGWRRGGGLVDRVAALDAGTEVCVFRSSDNWHAYVASRAARPPKGE